jgi:hypothetical protein
VELDMEMLVELRMMEMLEVLLVEVVVVLEVLDLEDLLDLEDRVQLVEHQLHMLLEEMDKALQILFLQTYLEQQILEMLAMVPLMAVILVVAADLA